MTHDDCVHTHMILPTAQIHFMLSSCNRSRMKMNTIMETDMHAMDMFNSKVKKYEISIVASIMETI